MQSVFTLANILWGASTIAEIILLTALIRHKLAATHRLLAIYIASTILQSALAVFVYTRWGFQSLTTAVLIWGSQGVVICLRFLAVYELGRRSLSQFKGIWSLAQRLLLITGCFTVGYSLLTSSQVYTYLILNLDRGLELTIAVFVVLMLVFARYYHLSIPPLDRMLFIGFCLYSCMYVINDSLLERYLSSYGSFWSYFAEVIFLATLLMWIRAVYTCPAPEAAPSPSMALPGEAYRRIGPELNLRLRVLDDQLAQLLRVRNQGS